MGNLKDNFDVKTGGLATSAVQLVKKMYVAKCVLVLFAAAAVSGFGLSWSDVEFHLYTRINPTLSQPIFPSVDSLGTSNFSPSRRTIITIHSNGESVSGNFNAFVIPGHLNNEDVNIIAVDWSRSSFLYSVGLANAPQAAELVAELINFLQDTFGYNPNLIRIVGVGLGGHIAGLVAKQVRGDVAHIIALDPSFHGWTHHPDILTADDADVVEVLHTTSGILGYDYPLGDIDFYPNGGTFQNGCATDSSCSHIYSYVFYAESLTAAANDGAQFVGTACDSYEDAIVMACEGERDAIFGGLDVKTSASGIYTFVTNFAQPFAQG